jgi:hypothetical protein
MSTRKNYLSVLKRLREEALAEAKAKQSFYSAYLKAKAEKSKPKPEHDLTNAKQLTFDDLIKATIK